MSDHALGGPQRGIIVDGEDGERSVAAFVDDAGLAGQGAVAVDAAIHAGAEIVAVVKRARRGVVQGRVGEAASGEASLNEGRGDARVVGEGGDERGVDTF